MKSLQEEVLNNNVEIMSKVQVYNDMLLWWTFPRVLYSLDPDYVDTGQYIISLYISTPLLTYNVMGYS